MALGVGFLVLGWLGTMVTVPAAMGAKMALPHEEVICISGDSVSK